jgi:hypothetical protein
MNNEEYVNSDGKFLDIYTPESKVKKYRSKKGF